MLSAASMDCEKTTYCRCWMASVNWLGGGQGSDSPPRNGLFSGLSRSHPVSCVLGYQCVSRISCQATAVTACQSIRSRRSRSLILSNWTLTASSAGPRRIAPSCKTAIFACCSRPSSIIISYVSDSCIRLAVTASGRVNDFLPSRCFCGAPSHPFEAVEIGHVGQCAAHRFVTWTKPFLANFEDGFPPRFLLSLIENNRLVSGILAIRLSLRAFVAIGHCDGYFDGLIPRLA